uniref:Uncharacterized protein n=1 Tax=Tetranychus urticae TaxID=32264 RepID=T1KXZ8_TETUR
MKQYWSCVQFHLCFKKDGQTEVGLQASLLPETFLYREKPNL